MNKIFTQLIEKRHLTDDYLRPEYGNLTPATVIPDMDKALDRIEKAIRDREKILIYGDYDVDGVTASTVMEQALLLAGAEAEDIEIMLPNRFTDGYGMSPRMVGHAKEAKTNLVITVDCGSRNHAIIDELNAAGIDTVVTDHHECEDTLPEAVAVLNPHRHDYTGPADLKDLAGVGMAFKVAQGLSEREDIEPGQEKWLLDLVLIGTICDSMCITRENRILTYYGKIVLEKTKRIGLQEVIKNAGVKGITSQAIGFQIGPRLNAAGRLESAEISLKLLRTTSPTEAASLAAKLEELNEQRRVEQRTAFKEITGRFKDPNHEMPPVIVESGAWHEGVLGIVAGRLVEQYHRPSFVLSKVDDENYKGSGRSFGEFNLAEALEHTKDLTTGGGGHAAAAGVSMKRESIVPFREKINEYYRSLHLADQEHFLHSEADLEITTLEDFNLRLVEDLALLEPFGEGNREPILCLRDAYIVNQRRMGAQNNHLRLDLRASDARTVKAVGFSVPESWFTLDDTVPHTFLIQPVVNEFNGVRSIEARLIDVLN